MSSGHPHEPARPRAFSYGRGNQVTSRYARPQRAMVPVPAAPAQGPETRQRKARNRRRRLWLFAVVTLVAAVAGAATIAGALAQPPGTVAEPPPPQAAPATAPSRSTPSRTTAEPGTPATPPPGTPPPPTAGQVPPPVGEGGGGQETTPAPPHTTAPRLRAPEPTGSPATVVYQNCAQARKAGAAPLYRGEPGYSTKLDKDGDGVACDDKTAGKEVR